MSTFLVRLPCSEYERVKEAVERIYGGGALMWDGGKAYPFSGVSAEPIEIRREPERQYVSLMGGEMWIDPPAPSGNGSQEKQP